jgi:hypothetical protein
MVFEYMFSTKASINQLGLSSDMLDFKDAMVIWLREIPVMCCMFKNVEFSVFIRIVFYIWKSIMEVFYILPLAARADDPKQINNLQ